MSRTLARSPHRRRHGAPSLAVALTAVVLVTATGCGTQSADDDAGATTSGTPGTSSQPAEPDDTEPSNSTGPSEPSEPSDSAEPAPPGTPACTEVWVAGERLPRGYRGCADGGDLVKTDTLACSSGQAIQFFGDRFWAYPGGPITKTAGPVLRDRDYKRAARRCRA